MATVVAPVVLVGGGLVAGRLAGWGWATAIFLGVVLYVLAVDAAWLVSGALAVRRALRAWRIAHELDEERTAR
jgi:hypothetical protein